MPARDTERTEPPRTRPRSRVRSHRLRVGALAMGLLAVASASAVALAGNTSAAEPAAFGRFSPYIDTSLAGGSDLDGVASASGARFLNLAFVVSSGGCTPAWGGSVPLSDPVRGEEIAALRAAGGDVRVSFGGAAGQELGLTCGDVDALTAAYQSVIDLYNLTHVDFDIEGGATSQVESVKRRNQAIKRLQDAARAGGGHLSVSYTLPVLPTGLLADSVALVEDAVAAGVDIEAVNIMAMDYGPGVSQGRPMGDLAIQAANSTADQLKAALGGGSADAALRKIAVTPMIGVNDVAVEIFRQDDARKLVEFAGQRDLAWLGFWSMGRDNGGCAGAGSAQAACSGVEQSQFEFARIFAGFTG